MTSLVIKSACYVSKMQITKFSQWESIDRLTRTPVEALLDLVLWVSIFELNAGSLGLENLM